VPGIYINDGGQTSSALGNILGGIATNLSPQTAAQAQLLREQTIQENLLNQLKQAQVQGIAGIPGTLGAANADPTAGSVASTLADAAQPPGPAPGTFGAQNITSGFSPFAKVLAGSYANDPGMANFGTGVNLGKDITTGPGSDFPTANTEHIAQHAPITISAGQQHIGDPTLAATGVNSILGPSSYGDTVEHTTGASNPASAEHDVGTGADATVNLGKLQGIQKLYDTIVAPESTPGGVLSEGVIKNISDYLGIPIDRVAQMQVPGVKAEIRARFASMVSNLRDNMGDPMFKGGLPQIMQQFPDPDLDPARFHSALGTLATTLQQQAADGQAATEYLKNPSPQAYVALLQQKAANAAQAKAAFANVGIEDKGEGAPPAGTGGSAATPGFAAAAAHLKQHPELRGAFDQKYGPGSAAKVLGQ
jgi:hypothetical protein